MSSTLTPSLRGRLPLRDSDPRLTKSCDLTFIGDWGGANLHKVCCWLTEEFCRRAGPKSRTAIWSLGGEDPVTLVQEGRADLCLTTPVMLAPAQVAGTGFYDGAPAPNLRGLAVIPQYDGMLFGVAPGFGIASFADLRAKRPGLRIATSPEGTTIGYVARLLLDAHGIGEAQRADWGITFVEDEHPFDSMDRVLKGEADAAITEAIMTPGWVRAIESGALVAIGAEGPALAMLERTHGFGKIQIPAGYYRPLTEPIDVLDFSDFLIVVRDDMPEDVAHLLTWCAVEARTELERQFMWVPANRSPITYPFDPKKMAQTRIPLHSGARRYYEEAGYV